MRQEHHHDSQNRRLIDLGLLRFIDDPNGGTYEEIMSKGRKVLELIENYANCLEQQDSQYSKNKVLKELLSEYDEMFELTHYLVDKLLGYSFERLVNKTQKKETK